MRRYTSWRILLLAILFILLIGACGSPDAEGVGVVGPDASDGEGGAEETATAETDQAASDQPDLALFPLTLIDGAGNEVTIEQHPETMIALIPSITETIFALGLGNQLVGVDDYSNYPEEALEIEQVGGLEINVEKVLSLMPD